ncbi:MULTISPECIES: nucleotide exchange factor GrpE [unclassified Clostridium]|uniref:nucleotide exchange factor GrpE n=1 Tax=unclassified Clostridium TaxID=2614128 RepID=UPI003216A2BD
MENNMEENQELDKKDMEDNADEILENDPSEKDQNEEEGTSGEETSEVKEEDDKEDEMKKFRNRKEEIKELKEENDSLKDKLLRTVAEYDNFRKRTSKEKENIYTEACADVLKEILPVLDNLERAVAVDGSAEDLKKGIELTINQFASSFEKLGVEEISSDGEFDPNFHDAVMHIEDENLGKNQVAEVFLKGYKKGDKVLRHSMVKVAN